VAAEREVATSVITGSRRRRLQQPARARRRTRRSAAWARHALV